jgi:cytochrome c-type biogenesis protein CcmH
MTNLRAGAAAMLWTSLCLIVFASTSHAQSAKSHLQDPVQAARFNDISDRLVCQCGCNMILRVCNHFECPSATPMRAQIEKQILAGMTDEAIIAEFVAEKGKVVLATPPPEGINLAAWVMPGFAVLIGLFLLSYFLAGWLAKKKVRPAATHAELDPSITKRIEKELQGMDR